MSDKTEDQEHIIYAVKSDLIKKYIEDIETETEINQNLLTPPGLLKVTRFYGRFGSSLEKDQKRLRNYIKHYREHAIHGILMAYIKEDLRP